MSGLSDREQKLLAVALLALALALAWIAVGAPIKSGFDARRDRREAAASRLRHDQRVAAAGPAVLAALRRDRDAANALTLPVSDLPTARKLAQLKVARAAASAGVRLTGSRITSAPAPLVSVEADLRGDFRSLAALLQALQADTPRAQINHWSETRNDDAPPGTEVLTVLDAHLTLTYAYRAPS